MSFRTIFAGTVLIAALAGASKAQQTQQVASVYHDVHQIASKYVNEDRTIWVRVPLDYSRTEEKYPVIYMLDGHAPQTSMMAGIIEQQAWAGMMPEAILVSIQNTNRSRDLTPVDDGKGGSVGGGDRFLDFVEKEVMPLVDGKYRTQPYRIFAGHSLGGLMSVYAMVTRPWMFNSYIAASPVLHFKDDFVIGKAKSAFKERKDWDKTLFVSIGNEPDYSNGFKDFRKLIENEKPKGLEFEFREFPEETHGSVVLRAYYWGLRKVFEGWQPDRIGSVADLERHYERLTKRFGYSILPPEAAMNRIGYQLLNAGRTLEAIDAFKKNAANYANSANVYDSLGEAYEKNGQRSKAAENYRRAVDLARAAGDTRSEAIFKGRLERLEND